MREMFTQGPKGKSASIRKFLTTFNANFDHVLLKISKKERHFLLIVFSKDFESAIRLTNFQF